MEKKHTKDNHLTAFPCQASLLSKVSFNTSELIVQLKINPDDILLEQVGRRKARNKASAIFIGDGGCK
jgi:hypothetical protein